MTRKAIIVGVVVLVGLAVLFVGSKYVSEGIGRGGKGIHLSAYFHDATGLVDKSRVQIAGLTVGSIYSRELEGRMAKVTVLLEPDVVVWSNATIYKRSASLLGEYYLEIDPGYPTVIDPATGQRVPAIGPDGKPVYRLQDWGWILNVSEAATMDALMRQVGSAVDQVNVLLRGPISDIARDVDRTTQDLDATIRQNQSTIAEALRRIDDIAGNVDNATGGSTPSDIHDILQRTKDTIAKIDDAVGKADLPGTATALRSALDRISASVDQVQHTVDNLSQISDTVRSGQGTVGELLENPDVAEDVAKTISHTEQLTADAAGFVHSITRFQTIVGLRSEYNVLERGLKAYVQLVLAPRPDKYYLIELVDDPRGLLTTTDFTVQNNPPTGPTYSYRVQERSDTFRFSFQFAKVIDFATLRFGIKESTGGVGLDLALSDRFALFSDLFDVEPGRLPRVKVLAAYRFFEQLYVVAGMDDILNGWASQTSPGRDYFFGAWLRFNDEDLKGLLTIGGSALMGGGTGK